MFYRLISLIFLLTVTSLTLMAQRVKIPPGTPKKAVRSFEKAQKIQKEDPEKALELYDKAIQDAPDFVVPRLFKASLLYRGNELEAAQKEFKSLRASGLDYPSKVLLTSGVIDYKLDDYASATQLLQEYLATQPRNVDLKKKAQKFLSHASFAAEAVRNPIDVNPQRMTESVNSTNNEYAPSITADGKTMVFSRRENGFELLYESKNVDGAWQEATPIDRINSVFEGGAHALSADGRLLVFTSCNRKDGFGSCDLFYSRFRRGEWTAPRNMGRPINSSAWDAQPALADNGQTLYFSSNRKGTLGGKDIWVSRRNKEGRWSLPINLGTDINTAHHEKTPFIHFDNESLYFMSSGHQGMGDFDLFMSRRVQDTSWSEPMNLGYPLNTRFQEGTLVIDLAGKKGYMTSDRHHHEQITKGRKKHVETDIFELDIPSDFAPKPSTFVEVQVVDGSTGKNLKADMDFRYGDGTLIWKGATQTDGYQLVCLPLQKDYALQIHHPEYTFYSERMELKEVYTAMEPLRINIELTKPAAPEAPSVILLKNVLFETGSEELRVDAEEELNFVARWLRKHEAIKIAIHGHTDNVGSEEDNLMLSKKRAQAVVNQLESLGVERSRMSSEGFGETKPIAENTTEEGRRQNRRTEMIILK